MASNDTTNGAAAFTACVSRFDEPEEAALREAIRALPGRGTVEVVCGWRALVPTVRTLEAGGLFAIEFSPCPDGRRARLTALKGKAGACYETGRSATLQGSAAAALDDDGHLLSGAMRVCEKTGRLYTLPPYRGLVAVSAPDPTLLARLDSDPLPFDCNTFAASAAALAARLADRAPDDSPAEPVLYAGPFRLLILDDGAMLPRGMPVRIATSQRARLAATHRLLEVPDELAAAVRPADLFPARYAREGTLCLLSACRPDTPAPAGPVPCDTPATAPDLAALDSLTAAMRCRLQTLIDRAAPYFLLTGSDPREAGGCCPNDEVGEANRLVEQGILARHRPPAHPDACPVSVYALAGEIRAGDADAPTFVTNEPLRREAASRLARPARAGAAAWCWRGTRLAVVGLFALGLAAAVRQSLPGSSSSAGPSLGDRIAAAVSAPRAPAAVLVVFLQAPTRCEACRTMLRLTRETLRDDFGPQSADGRVGLAVVDLGAFANRDLRHSVALPFSTLAVVRYENGRQTAARLLTDEAWRLYLDEPAFRAMLAEAIRSMEEHRP